MTGDSAVAAAGPSPYDAAPRRPRAAPTEIHWHKAGLRDASDHSLQGHVDLRQDSVRAADRQLRDLGDRRRVLRQPGRQGRRQDRRRGPVHDPGRGDQVRDRAPAPRRAPYRRAGHPARHARSGDPRHGHRRDHDRGDPFARSLGQHGPGRGVRPFALRRPQRQLRPGALSDLPGEQRLVGGRVRAAPARGLHPPAADRRPGRRRPGAEAGGRPRVRLSRRAARRPGSGDPGGRGPGARGSGGRPAAVVLRRQHQPLREAGIPVGLVGADRPGGAGQGRRRPGGRDPERLRRTRGAVRHAPSAATSGRSCSRPRTPPRRRGPASTVARTSSRWPRTRPGSTRPAWTSAG